VRRIALSVDDPDMKLGQERFIVRDANGHALAYVYFEDEPGRRTAAAHLLTRDEAWRISLCRSPFHSLRAVVSAITVPIYTHTARDWLHVGCGYCGDRHRGYAAKSQLAGYAKLWNRTLAR
jgi:hypothetical protein